MTVRTPVCDLLGIEHPIVGFSPSEHVAAAISRAGGLGVLGCVRFNDADELDEVLVPGRDHGAQVDGRALGGHLGGHHDVDAVRPAAGVLVHPVQGLVKLRRVVEADTAEHSQATRPADRGGDVLGRAEADDGMLEAKQVAQGRSHGQPPYELAAWPASVFRGRSRSGGWPTAYWRAQP